MERRLVTIGILAVVFTAGCGTLERAVRNERDRIVKEAVREEIETIVDEKIGSMVTDAIPWAATSVMTLLAGATGGNLIRKKIRETLKARLSEPKDSV